MLIHITPRLYDPDGEFDIALDDLVIPELGLHLRGYQELVTRRPYPNRHYIAACRNRGRAAVAGIFLVTAGHVDDFTLVARWTVDGGPTLTHRTRYVVLDQEHDAVTDNMARWYGRTSPAWPDRWPHDRYQAAPNTLQPRMDTRLSNGRPMEVTDVKRDGWIIERDEVFYLPTIERDRLLLSRSDWRIPALGDAFAVTGQTAADAVAAA